LDIDEREGDDGMIANVLVRKASAMGLASCLVLAGTPLALAQDMDRRPMTKIVGNTVQGAVIGGATGALAGLAMRATSKKGTFKLSKGSIAARGYGWGSAFGAGLGLLTGLASAAWGSKPVAVSSGRSSDYDSSSFGSSGSSSSAYTPRYPSEDSSSGQMSSGNGEMFGDVNKGKSQSMSTSSTGSGGNTISTNTVTTTTTEY
jgi:hypothetical protein